MELVLTKHTLLNLVILFPDILMHNSNPSLLQAMDIDHSLPSIRCENKNPFEIYWIHKIRAAVIQHEMRRWTFNSLPFHYLLILLLTVTLFSLAVNTVIFLFFILSKSLTIHFVRCHAAIL